jgi:hypothetical protein
MVKKQPYKLWQILAQKSDKFWRSFGNMYTQKLVWYCDDCCKKIKGVPHEKVFNHYCSVCIVNK